MARRNEVIAFFGWGALAQPATTVMAA